MGDPLTRQKVHNPEIVLSDVLRKEAGGLYIERGEYVPFMFRAHVYAIDTEGGNLENPDGDSSPPLQQTVTDGDGTRTYDVKALVGPENPPDSVKARIIGSNIDQGVNDDELRVYWPMFPGLSNPSPGELVYVVFEDAERDHGLWIAKVPFDNRYRNPNSVMFSDVAKVSANENLSSNYDDNPNSTDDNSVLNRVGDESLNSSFED